ncbi:hypothetical protein SBRCBS47491_001792 [Sporothrix bragantina]|uniref:Arylsulfatase n=1 Tax=Sporothrix bragantina TaxID=671064 RepID=A0ABP0B2D2_9PEZI
MRLHETSIALLGIASSALATKKPNILFILTDDQDWHMESMQHMPFLQKYLLHEGTLYSNHYCTVALCCPSRANLWTGMAAHNTNVTDVYPPYGGFPKFVKEGWNDNYLPIWMQQQGYNTYYSGKLWNGHNVDNYNAPYAGGFNGSDFILDPFTYEYYRAFMSRNGAPPVSYEGQYSPDVTAEKAYGFLEEATQHDEPWFLTIAPIAPHGDMRQALPFRADMPRYHPRHAHLFKNYKIPRTKNFNPEKPVGVGWIRDLPRLNDTVIEYNDEYQRARLRALQSVDEMVEQLVKTLDAKGLLDNTYIFYTTDNGYHISSRRMLPGKECSYDEDVHIPLLVRGPGVPPGHTTRAVTTHTDLAPTILQLAGGYRDDFDGAPIPLTKEQLAGPSRAEHVNVEYWGMAIPEGKYGRELIYGHGKVGEIGTENAARNNTYKSLRIQSDKYSLFYSVWCTGDMEYYDVLKDPDQIENYYGEDAEKLKSGYEIAGRPFEQVVNRLDALLMVLKTCKGQDCREPWSALHPSGGIETLEGALDAQFDKFYAEQPRATFTSCELGYIADAEGPTDHNTWEKSTPGDELKKRSFDYSGPWSFWT